MYQKVICRWWDYRIFSSLILSSILSFYGQYSYTYVPEKILRIFFVFTIDAKRYVEIYILPNMIFYKTCYLIYLVLFWGVFLLEKCVLKNMLVDLSF